jgi:hypothetical protein
VLCPVGPYIKQSNLNLPSRSFVNSQDRRLSLVNAHSLIHPSARRPISMLLDVEHAIQSHTVPEGALPWPSPSGATASWSRHLCAGTALVMRCVQAPATQVHRGPRPGALLPGQQAREVPCGAQALQRGEHAAHSEGGRPGAVGRVHTHHPVRGGCATAGPRARVPRRVTGPGAVRSVQACVRRALHGAGAASIGKPRTVRIHRQTTILVAPSCLRRRSRRAPATTAKNESASDARGAVIKALDGRTHHDEAATNVKQLVIAVGYKPRSVHGV